MSLLAFALPIFSPILLEAGEGLSKYVGVWQLPEVNPLQIPPKKDVAFGDLYPSSLQPVHSIIFVLRKLWIKII